MTHEEIMAEISRPSTRIRFEAKVVRIPEAGCWVWTTLNRRQGMRRIGAELVGVMDDFGNLVYAEGAC